MPASRSSWDCQFSACSCFVCSSAGSRPMQSTGCLKPKLLQHHHRFMYRELRLGREVCLVPGNSPYSLKFPTCLVRFWNESAIVRARGLLVHGWEGNRDDEPSCRIPAPGLAVLRTDLRNMFERFRSIQDRKSTRLNSSHLGISYAVFCLRKKHTT